MNNRIVDLLQQIWEHEPDLRLGQIISNSIPHCGVYNDYELYLFNYKDDLMVQKLEQFLEKITVENDGV